MFESRGFRASPDRLINKIEQRAVTKARAKHEQDTQARTELVRDSEGNLVIGADGRPVEAIYGPLTKKGVPVGRRIDVMGRGRELRNAAAGTRMNNAMLIEEAQNRAAGGHPTDFTVGGQHQWSQNLAYEQPNNPTAGKTNVRGPGATGGPPPAGLAGTPYTRGGGGGGGHQGPMEFSQRRIDFEGASQDATGLAGMFAKIGAMGERRGARQDAKAWAKDRERGFERPIIGFRPAGGNVDFSRQQFGPMGHGPASRPGSPTTNTAPQVGFNPGGPPQPAPRPVPPTGFQPPAAGPQQKPPGPAPSPLSPIFQPPAPTAPPAGPRTAPGNPFAPPAAPAAPTPQRRPLVNPATNPFQAPAAAVTPVQTTGLSPARPATNPFAVQDQKPSFTARVREGASVVKDAAEGAGKGAAAARPIAAALAPETEGIGAVAAEVVGGALGAIKEVRTGRQTRGTAKPKPKTEAA